MARRVFFSFHFDRDAFRANQVRNCNVVVGADVAGFFDHSEYEEAKKTEAAGIQRMINRHLDRTSVTVVLIGSETSSRMWVRYEIEQSIARKNGLVGIYIHDLVDQLGKSSARGLRPTVPMGVPFPAYDWDKDVKRFANEIEAAGKRADIWRAAK